MIPGIWGSFFRLFRFVDALAGRRHVRDGRLGWNREYRPVQFGHWTFDRTTRIRKTELRT